MASEITGLEEAGFCKLNLDDGDDSDRVVLHDLFQNDLRQDRWLPDGHDYRFRAYQCFSVGWPGGRLNFMANPPPYVQAEEVNSIAGGLQRRFRSLPEHHPATAITCRLARVFMSLMLDSGVAAADRRFVLDAHYIRISAPGKPCPEGVHRDGLVAGSVHLVSLENVVGGETHFMSDSGAVSQSLRLTNFLDSVIFDDKRLLHYTDDIYKADPNREGYRDVLLLGLREGEG